MRRICLVGPYSSALNPIGLHLRRLKPILTHAGFPVTVFDSEGGMDETDDVVPASSPVATLRRLWSLQPSIIDFHAEGLHLRLGLAIALLAAKHQVIMSLHAGSTEGAEIAWSWFQRSVLSWTRLVIVHDVTSLERAKRLTWKGRIIGLPEYLPPGDPPPVEQPGFSDLRAKHQYLIVASAPEMGVRLGGDVHGAGILINAMQRLVHEDGMDVAAIFHVTKSAEPASMKDVRQRLADAGLGERWEMAEGQPDLLPALGKIAHAFVRPGGASLERRTQRDVMSWQVPVVVSDASETEAGARSFRQGDVADLHRVLKEVLGGNGEAQAQLEKLPFRQTADRYVQMYRSLVRERIA